MNYLAIPVGLAALIATFQFFSSRGLSIRWFCLYASFAKFAFASIGLIDYSVGPFVGVVLVVGMVPMVIGLWFPKLADKQLIDESLEHQQNETPRFKTIWISAGLLAMSIIFMWAAKDAQLDKVLSLYVLGSMAAMSSVILWYTKRNLPAWIQITTVLSSAVILTGMIVPTAPTIFAQLYLGILFAASLYLLFDMVISSKGYYKIEQIAENVLPVSVVLMFSGYWYYLAQHEIIRVDL